MAALQAPQLVATKLMPEHIYLPVSRFQPLLPRPLPRCFTCQLYCEQEMTDWLRGKDIIGGLLRANLHLAQYVAQVSCKLHLGCTACPPPLFRFAVVSRQHSRHRLLRANPVSCALLPYPDVQKVIGTRILRLPMMSKHRFEPPCCRVAPAHEPVFWLLRRYRRCS